MTIAIGEPPQSKPTGSRERAHAHARKLWEGAKAGLFPKSQSSDFKALYLEESTQLAEAESLRRKQAGTERRTALRREDPNLVQVAHGVGGDAWVAFTPHDRFGLALSGGGIRSATFNLGLMQALARLQVLKHVDYLATVSGGGYIGGFWTAWLARRSRKADRLAPDDPHFPLGAGTRGDERAEVRHLREFSRFLLPRISLIETEFWAVVMTVLGGLLPSLVAALAVLTLAWGAWMAVMFAIAPMSRWGSATFVGLLATFYVLSELRWLKAKRGERSSIERVGFWVGAALGLVLANAGWVRRDWMPVDSSSDAILTSAYGAFAPPILLTGVFVVLIVIRTVIARARRTQEAITLLVGVERSIARIIGLTAGLTAVAAVWWATDQVENAGRVWGAVGVGGTAGLAGLFAWASKWLAEPPKDTRGARFLRNALGGLKRATPRVLATLVWVLLVLLVGTGVRWASISDGEINWRWFIAIMGLSGGNLLLTMWWFDPARVGLHEFYRSRISRCYLGASNRDGNRDGDAESDRAARNRYVGERPGDDVTLGDMREAQIRPIHLVCTAANDLSGDHLGTLYRGAKSAVLSPNGITVDGLTARLDYLRLSAALTASAAAFNSQMGRVSMNLGPPVAFLMSALNLRLGLWVPHPNNPKRKDYRLPGRFFLLELFGHSRADSTQLHLSDGAHFENLALYELIRRHCRYIIASDCGADPEVTFDDLANVLRRVREDFGVEVELDVDPLRPDAEGRTPQHAVIGTIHYDGFNGVDKGTLLYFKPGVTGDEPPDVVQYRTQNGKFPHESTGDQFYDEAQWESYRRLGQHAGRDTLGYAESVSHERAFFVDRLFLGARERLHPAAPNHQETFVAMSQRCADLEASVFAEGPESLRKELFAEAVELKGDGPDLENEIQSLSYLMRAIQIMEDVWVAADLEHYWSHPLNEGWMAYFQRWASTPSFRRWWPILRPIYSNRFRDFAKEHFGVGVRDAEARSDSDPQQAVVRLRLYRESQRDVFTTGHAWRQFVQRSVPPPLDGLAVLVYRMELVGEFGGNGSRPLDVGFALITEKGPTASWHAHHFFVPPALMGGGIIGRMLDSLVEHYRKAQRITQLEVVFSESDDAQPRGRAARDERVKLMEFFKSRGFRPVPQTAATLGKMKLTLELR